MLGKQVACIAVSDLHLTLTPPSCRREKDWLGVMAGYFDQLKQLHYEIGGHDVPLVCAGDVFDRPSPPVELVNWAIRTLPRMYAIPGQHDCAFHRLEDLKKSGYWTLVEAGTLTNLEYGNPVAVGNVRLHGFPWGTKITPWPDNHGLALEIAVVHKYIWTRGKSYPNAPKEARAGKLQDQLVGYDIAVVGDNHSPFELAHTELCSVINCGSFLRRKRDEIPHRPSIVVIYADGTCGRHYLDTSKDQFNDVEEKGSDGRQREFAISLADLGGLMIDFADVLRRSMEGEREEVRKIVRELLEEGK